MRRVAVALLIVGLHQMNAGAADNPPSTTNPTTAQAPTASQASEPGTNDPARLYNLGTREYQQREYDAAVSSLERASSTSTPPLRSRIAYNLGNSFYRQAQSAEQQAPDRAASLYGQAVAQYKSALRRDPADADAQFNYELALQRMKQTQQQSQQQQQQNSKQSQNQQSSKSQSSQGSSGSSSAQPSQAGQQNGQQAEGSQGSQASSSGGSQNADSTGHNQQQAAGSQPSDASKQQANEGAKPDQSMSDHQGTVGTKDSSAQPTPSQSSAAQAGQPGSMSQEEALAILDAARRNEGGPPSTERKPAQDAPVEKDW